MEQKLSFPRPLIPDGMTGLCDPVSSRGLTGDADELSSGSDDLLDAFLEEAEQKVACIFRVHFQKKIKLWASYTFNVGKL